MRLNSNDELEVNKLEECNKLYSDATVSVDNLLWEEFFGYPLQKRVNNNKGSYEKEYMANVCTQSLHFLGQFHQQFTCNFYAHRSQMRKKTLMT